MKNGYFPKQRTILVMSWALLADPNQIGSGAGTGSRHTVPR